MDTYLIVAAVGVVAVMLLWLFTRERSSPTDTIMEDDRLDTLIGWPPEATRILRRTERAAYTTLKLALPGQMIFAQMPLSRFITVPKRNSYAQWMRRLGSQCVDFVVCDAASQVIAVVDVRAPDAQLSDRVQRRVDRLARTLDAVGIPLHVWNEEALPSVEMVRASIQRREPAASNAGTSTRAVGASTALAPSGPNPFEDLGRDPSLDEVIEMPEQVSGTWFDELDSQLPAPPRVERKSG